jgi:hypothetical protein
MKESTRRLRRESRRKFFRRLVRKNVEVHRWAQVFTLSAFVVTFFAIASQVGLKEVDPIWIALSGVFPFPFWILAGALVNVIWVEIWGRASKWAMVVGLIWMTFYLFDFVMETLRLSLALIGVW